MTNKLELDYQIDKWIEDKIDIGNKTARLIGDVDSEMLDLVITALHLFGGADCKFILNSTGGEEEAGLGICDLITAYPGEVTVDVYGQAESMAAIILQAADVRRISKNSNLMLHEGEKSAPDGMKKNIKNYMDHVDEVDAACDAIVLKRVQEKHPKYSWAKFRKVTQNDIYFSASESLKWGLVDVII